MRRFALWAVPALILLCAVIAFDRISTTSQAQTGNGRQKPKKIQPGPGKKMAEDKAGIQRLKARTNGRAEVKINNGTGAARFINFAGGRRGELSDLGRSANATEKSKRFFSEFGSLFGIDREGVELRLDNEVVDSQGHKHQNFKQFYKGVPVFASMLKTHFNATNELYTVNGNAIPEIEVDTTPAIDENAAAGSAIAVVEDQKGTEALTAKNNGLYVYRTGLAEGVPGEDFLAYEIEVTNHLDVREFVYVDAKSNMIVDQVTGIYDAMDRRAYDGKFLAQNQVGTFYPSTPFWVEGQDFPTGNTEADNMILASKETYDFFMNAFGRDSFNGAGRKMDSIFNRGYSCPNASWNGTYISFCNGMTSDDVTAHEWGHAYTQFTHGLIYAYQPGALNEAYSDIFGETVDRLNARDTIGNSEGDALRTADSCSIFSPSAPRFFINAPQAIAGPYSIGRALFGPGYTATGVTADVVRAVDADEDGAGTANTVNDGCSALTNAASVAGKIAFIDRGVCGFKLKTKNAQDAGAIGVIIGNVPTSGSPNSVTNMSDDASITTPITIPAVHVALGTANTIRTNAAAPVNASIKATNNSDASSKWLLGEDDTAAGLTGALRDMHNPTCYGNPGKMSDTLYYSCDIYPGSDNGGVHVNSGVPNHAYALLVDGGTFNGQTISAIGLTKAAHIYYRAQAVYQVPNSNFADHADSIEQSALDLATGQTVLADLKTGAPSGEVVTAEDVTQVKNAMLAVEMRKSAPQCGAVPVLAKNPPADPTFTVPRTFYEYGFENGPAGWTVGNEFVAGATPRNWGLTDAPERTGIAAYVSDPAYSCAVGAKNQTGVMHLNSPVIQIPVDATGLTLTFDHRVATEAGYDGGQLMVSIDGGEFVLVSDAAFAYNSYNSTLHATGNSNPRAGQKAFSGTDDPTDLLEGSWGRSVVNLTTLELNGKSVRFRWDFSNDECGGQNFFGYGWFVDNVRVLGGLVDDDADGVADSVDSCPGTVLSPKVIIGAGKFSQTNVPNVLLPTGCTLQQLIDASKTGAASQGAYVSAVSELTDQWVADGIIRPAQKDAIMRAVAQKK